VDSNYIDPAINRSINDYNNIMRESETKNTKRR